MKLQEHNIYIGPAGWSYPDWEGVVYPVKKGRSFSPLKYLSEFFDTIEINSTFYRIPRPSFTEKWIEQVAHNKRFQFTVKVWQKFTHEINTYSDAEVDSFKESIEALVGSGRLGALLFQFPWRFKFDPDNKAYLIKLLFAFKDYPRVVEFRHASWNTVRVISLFKELNVGFANIDQPIIGRAIPPTNYVTSEIAYLRLHGRNYQNWFREDAGRDARYDYLYREDEIDEWKEKVVDVAEKAKKTFIIFNNHFRGQAVVNSLQLIAKLRGEKLVAPGTLLSAYPILKSCCYSEGTQQSLF